MLYEQFYLLGHDVNRHFRANVALLSFLLPIHIGFLIGLFFYPEDGGDMFLRIVVWLSMDYTAFCPRRYNSPCHCCKNLKFYTPLFEWAVRQAKSQKLH
jgi:hypothetical protein